MRGPLRRGTQLGTVKGGHARSEHKITPSLEAAEQVGREVRLPIFYQILSVTSVPVPDRQPRCTIWNGMATAMTDQSSAVDKARELMSTDLIF